MFIENSVVRETDVSGWTAWVNNVTVTKDTTQHWQGSASLKETAAAAGDDVVSTGPFAANASTAYTYSAYVNVPTACVHLLIFTKDIGGFYKTAKIA